MKKRLEQRANKTDSRTGKIKNKRRGYFSKLELFLWIGSMLFILLSFCLFDRENILTLTASLIGTTSLIFSAKGNPFGPCLMIVFSLLYGVISFSFAYYGEVITYVGMTLPMAVFSLVAWLKNPFQGKKPRLPSGKSRAKKLSL